MNEESFPVDQWLQAAFPMDESIIHALQTQGGDNIPSPIERLQTLFDDPVWSKELRPVRDRVGKNLLSVLIPVFDALPSDKNKPQEAARLFEVALMGVQKGIVGMRSDLPQTGASVVSNQNDLNRLIGVSGLSDSDGAVFTLGVIAGLAPWQSSAVYFFEPVARQQNKSVPEVLSQHAGWLSATLNDASNLRTAFSNAPDQSGSPAGSRSVFSAHYEKDLMVDMYHYGFNCVSNENRLARVNRFGDPIRQVFQAPSKS